MKTELEILLQDFIGEDYSEMSAKDFCTFIIGLIAGDGYCQTEVMVDDRGDGRRGRVDIVFHPRGRIVGIELDRITPRKKSIAKLKSLGADESYVITRAPFTIHNINTI